MTIRRVFAAVLLFGVSVWAQSGGLGSMRDPRLADQQSSALGAIEPWLAVSGNYDDYLDQPVSSFGTALRSVSVGGGLSAVKSFQRTVLIFGYAGSGTDYIGRSAGIREGWMSSNVANLAVSTQVTRRLTLDFSEAGGAANGGFGAASAGLQSGGLGVLSTLGVAGGFLAGAGAGLGSASGGLDVLQNSLIDADYYTQMTYFSSTSASAGFLLSNRTMLNIGGTGSFVRREGRSFSDANLVGADAMLSIQLTRRLSSFFGYTFNQIDFIKSIGNSYIQSGFVGINYALSQHDRLSLSLSDSYLESKFVTTVALPPDVAALLGISTTTIVGNNSRSYLGGKLAYRHAFQRSGFEVACSSMLAPGNDLILMARSEGCTMSLSRELASRLSVMGIGGMRRLTGLSQSSGRYDVLSGGVVFSYRMFRGVSLIAGATYRATDVRPSSEATTDVLATAGLRWAPREALNPF